MSEAEEAISTPEPVSTPEPIVNGERPNFSSSIRSDIEAAINKVESKGKELASEIKKTKTVKEESSEPPPKDEDPEDSSSTEESETEEADNDDTGVEDDDGEEEKVLPKVSSRINAPTSWSKEDRKVFEKLPKEAQAIVLRRENQRDSYLTEKVKEIESLKREYDDIDDAIAPYEATWDLQGISASNVIRQAVAMRQNLLENPGEFIRWAAAQARVDLAQLSQSPNNQPQHDPRISQLAYQNQQLQAQLQAREQAAKEQQHSLVKEEVMRFASETDASGNDLRPHFEKVWPDMMREVQFLRGFDSEASNYEILDKAYAKALRLNGLDREERVVKSDATSQKEKVAKAKKAATSVKSNANVNGLKRETAVPLRQQLLELYDKSVMR